MSSFINRIARQRIEARQAEQIDAPGVKGAEVGQGQSIEGPELRPGGRPTPKKTNPVITSYSIHYTKLYDNNRTCSKRHW